MSVEIAWKQNILVTDFYLLKSLLVVLGFGSQAFVCGFSRQNINSVAFLENMNFKGKNQVYGACCYVQTTHQPVSTNSANILRAYCSIKYTLVASMLYSCMCVPTYSSV